MTEEKSTILLILSRVLEYPDPPFFKGSSEMAKYMKEHLTSPVLQKELIKRLRPLYAMGLKELQELYVETFDHKEKTSLYLTAHELGDSRKRGFALIQIQNLIVEAGFELMGKELADYIPMLLELLAVASEDENVGRLKGRLANAIHRIRTHLPDSNPYHQVMDILMTYVFESPSVEELARWEYEREEADLDPLPYPMLYQ